MKQKPSSRRRRNSTKSVLRLPDLEHAKAAVLSPTAFTVIPSPHAPPYFVDPAEQPSLINSGRGEPIVQFGSHPIGNRNRSNMASLAYQIDNGPVFFALLEMF